jgi:hypothetical protein
VKKRSRRPFETEKTYPATVGLILGVLGPKLPLSSRPRRILKDRFGGILTISEPTKEDKIIWAGASRCHPKPFDEITFAIKYRVEAEWGDSLLWWEFPMRMGHLAAHALQIEGPFPGDAYYVCYARRHGEKSYQYWIDVPSRFTPALWHRTGFSTFRVPKSLDGLCESCRRLHAALGDRFLFDRERWRSEKPEEVIGTRLETSLLLYSQSMMLVCQQDICLRLHIAIEALFKSNNLGKSAVALVAALLLRRRVDPDITLKRALDIYEWRNRFVHGNEPAFQYPRGSKATDSLVNAAASGTYLLTDLYHTILSNPKLLAIFNSRVGDQEFARQLFQSVTKG